MNKNLEYLNGLYSEISEISGYIWQRGWAEFNAGNISIRLDELEEELVKHLPVSKLIQLRFLGAIYDRTHFD